MPTTLLRYLSTLLLLAAASLPTAAEEQQWKIGLLLCLSGECAADGQDALHGATLAAEELNSRGGVLGRQIVFETEDTTEAVSGARVVSAFKRLRLDPEIQFFIGPSWSPGGLALAPLAAKIPEILITTPSLGVKGYHLAGSNIFNVRGTDEISSRKIARYAARQGWKQAVVWSSQQPWEAAQAVYFEEEFKAAGGKVVLKIEPLPTVTNLRAEALQVKTARPDVLFFSSIIQLGIASKELRTLKFDAPKIAANLDEVRLRQSEGALEGTRFYTLMEPSEDFAERYRRAHPEAAVNPVAASSYDIVMMYARAIEQAGSFEISQVQKLFAGLLHDGASGQLAFDAEGGAKRQPILKVVRNSSIVTVTE